MKSHIEILTGNKVDVLAVWALHLLTGGYLKMCCSCSKYPKCALDKKIIFVPCKATPIQIFLKR